MTDARRRSDVLRRLVDTLIPHTPAPDGLNAEQANLFALRGSDVKVDMVLGLAIDGMARHVRTAVERALDALPAGYADLDDDAARDAWLAVRNDRTTAFGSFVVQSTACAMFYTLPDEQGTNPTWPALRFDGQLLPLPSEDQFPKTLRRLDVAVIDHAPIEVKFDAVVVGSGAGGGVAAARLAAAGRSVLVLEKGTYRNEPDLPQLEALSFPNLYLDGGYIWSTTGSLACLAGSTVGGGTTVNSMACMPPPPAIREEWERLGLSGVSRSQYDYHINSVMHRINAVPANSHYNSVNRIMNRGFDALGMSHYALARNAKDDDDRYCGACNAGCLVGCKQSTMKTFLQDASDHGALLLDRCAVQRVRVSNGRAAGVDAMLTQADGTTVAVTVIAPVVVLACGALVTPTILQASGIGGPAVGQHLHVHPSYFMSGVFDEDVLGWRGQILTSVSQDFERIEGDYGFVIEAAPMGLGFWAGLTAWHDGRASKLDQLRFPHVSGVWGFVRDREGGNVWADEDGRPVVEWNCDGETDLAVTRRCHVQLARVLRAAGAREIFTFLPGDPRWREGEDFEAFVSQLATMNASDVFTLSAHQTGSCRVGLDPATSVVDGTGELHDTGGVWIVDASILPTAPGVNPMVSIEATASLVSENILSANTVPA